MILTKQCEIYSVNFNPSIGKEIQKLRPAVIIDNDMFAKIQMRMVVPITTWQDRFAEYPWMIKINPNDENGLKNISAFNIQQTRYVTTQRFKNKIGEIDKSVLADLHRILYTLLKPNF